VQLLTKISSAFALIESATNDDLQPRTIYRVTKRQLIEDQN